MQRTLKITSDGSHTLYVPELEEHYHSIHGAVQESNHVFIGAGLKEVISRQSLVIGQESIKILEVGMGTGLNVLLTLLEGEKTGLLSPHPPKSPQRGNFLAIEYTAIEAFPLEKEIYSALNYSSVIPDEKAGPVLYSIHSSAWNTPIDINHGFTLLKVNEKLENIVLGDNKFNLVYFDAFAPEVQPELWPEAIFKKIYNAMAPNGILVTYCCKGDVKRAMKTAGFTIEKLPGPPGKREMLRAKKEI